MRLGLCLAVLASLTVAGPGRAAAGTIAAAAECGYQIHALPTLTGSGPARVVGAAAGTGPFAGASSASVGGQRVDHAVLWTDGAVVDLTPGLATSSVAVDVNTSGVVVGTMGDAGALWRDGVATLLPGISGASLAIPRGITEDGLIVGVAASGLEFHVVWWHADDPSVVHDLGPTGDIATDVDDSGKIAGMRGVDRVNAVAGTTAGFSLLGGVEPNTSVAYAVAGRFIVGFGRIVGQPGSTPRPVLWEAGQPRYLSAVPDNTVAADVSSSGLVAGNQRDSQFRPIRAQIWSPGATTGQPLPTFAGEVTVAAVVTEDGTVGGSSGEGTAQVPALWTCA